MVQKDIDSERAGLNWTVPGAASRSTRSGTTAVSMGWSQYLKTLRLLMGCVRTRRGVKLGIWVRTIMKKIEKTRHINSSLILGAL